MKNSSQKKKNIEISRRFAVSLNRRLTVCLSNFSADKEETFDNDPDPAYTHARVNYTELQFFFFLNKILREWERNFE